MSALSSLSTALCLAVTIWLVFSFEGVSCITCDACMELTTDNEALQALLDSVSDDTNCQQPDTSNCDSGITQCAAGSITVALTLGEESADVTMNIADCNNANSLKPQYQAVGCHSFNESPFNPRMDPLALLMSSFGETEGFKGELCICSGEACETGFEFGSGGRLAAGLCPMILCLLMIMFCIN